MILKDEPDDFKYWSKVAELEEKYEILEYFRFGHLPNELQKISKIFSDVAHEVAHQLALNYAENKELEICFRKLLEAKDCAIRATLKNIRLGKEND